MPGEGHAQSPREALEPALRGGGGARKAGWGGNLSDAEAFRLREFQDWYLPECQGAEIGFVSYHDNPINVFWVDEATGGRVEQGLLRRGAEHGLALVAHRAQFALVDAETAEELGTYEGSTRPSTPSSPRSSPWTRSPPRAPAEGREIQARCVSSTTGPRRQAQLHAHGLRERGLPQLDPYVWGSVRRSTTTTRPTAPCASGTTRALRELVGGRAMVIQILEAEDHGHDRMRILVEEWIGSEALERTDIYGIRVYQRGAQLLSHVDRFETRRVAHRQRGPRGNPDTPWPVEIYDHSDHLHEVRF